jgi:type III pantothenate kinase
VILLIDAGNTRIKWAVTQQAAWLAEGVLAHSEIASLPTELGAFSGIRRVLGANVAGPRIATAIADALRPTAPAPEWLQATEHCCGVHNGYARPAQLGPDRWAALIGARHAHRGPCLVVSAGTATTVDLLDERGRFQGGLILPGEELMRRSLASNTAELPFADGRYEATPRNTADAIASGCLNAQAGAVERMFRRIAASPDALCLVSGGGAVRLLPLLSVPSRHIDNLVLKGLAVVAGDAPPS